MIELPLLVSLIVAVTQVIKEIGIPAKYCPLFNLLIGAFSGLAFIEGDISTKILTGLLLGLTASGLFDVGKIPFKTK